MPSWFVRVVLGLAFAAGMFSCSGIVPQSRAQVSVDPPDSRGQHLVNASKFEAWLKDFAASAVESGVNPRLVSRAFSDLSFNGRVLELEAFQPEFVRPVWEYLARAVSERRIGNGQRKARQHALLLEALQGRYGVPPEILVAIWGVETGFGEQLGSFNVIEALATTAFGGRRTNFARRELLAALDVLAEINSEASSLRGSWAGAMGHTQFIPSTFLEHAVDHDGDGRRNGLGR